MPGLLRDAGWFAVLAGAIGAVGLLFMTGSRNDSNLLVVAFIALWVVSPFVVLAVAHRISRRWSALTRAALSSVALLITVITLAIYAPVAFGPPKPRAVFWFVVVPPASWLLTAISVSIAGLISRRRSRRGIP